MICLDCGKFCYQKCQVRPKAQPKELSTPNEWSKPLTLKQGAELEEILYHFRNGYLTLEECNSKIQELAISAYGRRANVEFYADKYGNVNVYVEEPLFENTIYKDNAYLDSIFRKRIY